MLLHIAPSECAFVVTPVKTISKIKIYIFRLSIEYLGFAQSVRLISEYIFDTNIIQPRILVPHDESLTIFFPAITIVKIVFFTFHLNFDPFIVSARSYGSNHV